MADFSPGTGKNNSSKLNTEIQESVEDRSGSFEGETVPGTSVPEEETAAGADGHSASRRKEKDRNKAASGGETGEGTEATAGEKEAAEGKADSSENSSPDGSVSEKDSGDEEKAGDSVPSGDSGGSSAKSASVPDSSGHGGTAPAAAGRKPGIQTDLTGPAAGKSAGKAKSASYRDKILRHKKRRYWRTVILVALAMAVLVALVILWMRHGYTRAELIRVSALAAEDGACYENLGGNVVQYGNSGAVCVDSRGNTLWDVSYEMQQPITSVSGDVIAIANRSGYYVYVMNSQGLMGTIQTTLPIHSIAASDSGEVAVIMDDTASTWVRLYTAEGKEIAYLVRTMEENGYPVAAAVSPDGETLCLSSISMSNAAVKTNISFYNFGSAGQKANDHLVQHADFIDEVIPYLHYIDNTTCVSVSDKQLFCFWSTIFRSSGSCSVQLPENILGVFCGDSFIGILSSNTKGDTQYKLDLYNKRGKNAGSVNFTMQYTDIDIAGDKIYVHNEQECQIYTISGRCLFNGSFDKPIRAMVPGAGLSDLLVVTDGEVDNVRLH